MERNVNKVALVNLVVLLLIGLASAVLARYSSSLAGHAGIIFLGLGFLVVAVGYFQMRMEESERIEKLEFEEINKARPGGSLFSSAESEVFPARRSREQFERFFLPGFTVLLFLAQAGGAYWLWTWLGNSTPKALLQPTVAMSLFGLFALTLFLLGKYSIALAREESGRLLRPGASYLLLGAYISFLITACIAGVVLGFGQLDLYAAYALAGVLALMATETLINLIFELYRPRVKGRAGRVIYDSRLVGLMAEPESLFATAAQALDYQFGFKVSETWFYRFLQKAMVWLVLLQLSVLAFSTCFVFISPGEQGLIERFGSPVKDRPVLNAGLHMKLPWPVDKVFRYRTSEMQTFIVGSAPGEEKEGRAVLWSGKHAKDEVNWMVATPDEARPAAAGEGQEGRGDRGVPVDLLNLSVPVQFTIKDLHAWAYKHTDAAGLLEKMASREITRYLASIDLMGLVSTRRSEAADQLREDIQAKADELELGVNITFVGLQDMHPPGKVAAEFQKVISAGQESASEVYKAKGYAAKTVSLAGADAQRIISEMHSYSNRTVSAALAHSLQFTNQMTAFRAAPRVYMERSYLQAMQQGMTNSDKFIWGVKNENDIIEMNLEQRVRRDLIDNLNIPQSRR
jgi:regulator of protease activity HflC (stomatin/prohibitin superfamily)